MIPEYDDPEDPFEGFESLAPETEELVSQTLESSLPAMQMDPVIQALQKEWMLRYNHSVELLHNHRTNEEVREYANQIQGEVNLLGIAIEDRISVLLIEDLPECFADLMEANAPGDRPSPEG
tara:strand:- start:461 stop:826 length:366 start_codon:yes stop_codon:yes gene_type:complete